MLPSSADSEPSDLLSSSLSLSSSSAKQPLQLKLSELLDLERALLGRTGLAPVESSEALLANADNSEQSRDSGHDENDAHNASSKHNRFVCVERSRL